MPINTTANGFAQGLSDTEVIKSRQTHGSNVFKDESESLLSTLIKGVVLEPMFLLLLATCLIYFLTGQYQEGIIMIVALCIISAISLLQEYRSKSAINALRKLSASKIQVIRNGVTGKIEPGEIVVGDLMLLEEGEIIPADGLIVLSNDFSVNESVLTGESFPVIKSAPNQDTVFKGTMVTSGTATVQVTEVGAKTKFGQIGKLLAEAGPIKTPLQVQIASFVKVMVIAGGIAFVVVVAYNYIASGNFIQSLLRGLTLAMSILPEEIPVAFATFQALGAFRLIRHKIIVRQPQYVETLGSATVICVDKTGTLTSNLMKIAYLYDAIQQRLIPIKDNRELPVSLIENAMWASETQPFDPMEKAIHALYSQATPADLRPLYQQVHEYPIGGKPPLMTHIFKGPQNKIIIAAKGAPEAILQQSNLSAERKNAFAGEAANLARKGFRVLGVGTAEWNQPSWPASQQEFTFSFLGLVAFNDPPKENISKTLDTFYKAGINVKMITGDYKETAAAIAEQVGIKRTEKIVTGEEILSFTEDKLRSVVKEVDVYARMFPGAKVKVIDALIKNGEVVAMTGDGVNDAPALKVAHIGIAMGQRGSEVAKNAASLIIADDDLKHMTDAVAMGRKIYDNMKKAIQYIVSIHIPIILVVMLPLVLAWKFSLIFTPVHVVFFELIMGPTCSIIYENEPMEPGTMLRPPRMLTDTFLSMNQLFLSLVQGLAITASCLIIGYLYMQQGATEKTTRTVIFICLLFSNIFLTLANRSFRFSISKTLRYKNPLLTTIILITILFIPAVLYIPLLRDIFSVEMITLKDIMYTLLAAVIGTLWIDIWKRYSPSSKSN